MACFVLDRYDPFKVGPQTMGLQICIECNGTRAVCMACIVGLLNMEPLHYGLRIYGTVY